METLAGERLEVARSLLGLEVGQLRSLVPFDLPDAFNPSLRLSGFWCQNTPKSGSIVIFHEGTSPILIPGPPIVRTCRRNLADFADPRLVNLPETASFGLIPIPDGPVQIVFFRYESCGSERISGLKWSRNMNGNGVELSDRSRLASMNLLGSWALQRPGQLSPLLAPLRDPNCQAIVFDLCGDTLPGLVAHGFDIGLVPFLVVSPSGDRYPFSPSALAHDQMLNAVSVIRGARFPRNLLSSRLATTRGSWIVVLDDDDYRFTENVVYECTPDILEKDMWRYFTAEIEAAIRHLVFRGVSVNASSLRLDFRLWYKLERAIQNFASTISSPIVVGRNKNDHRLMLIVCGFPGSGKSHFTQGLIESTDNRFVSINQDVLRSREQCLRVARAALTSGMSTIVDRTNMTRDHRSYFLKLAAELGVGLVICIVFDVPPEICGQRIMERIDHPTLPAVPESIAILHRFVKEFERPALEEGFNQILVIKSPRQVESLIAAIRLQEKSESGFIEWPNNGTDYKVQPIVDDIAINY
uniref:Uncharacterized protein n=1 Tax=Spongospora subterranea TaxID=70186 RepID=A0A0H5R7J8_9EUKA|eukprot:CRZ10135.1 hypothetical protein [Spongospora subterranea]